MFVSSSSSSNVSITFSCTKISSNLSVKRALKLIDDLFVNYSLPKREKFKEKNYAKGMQLMVNRSK